MSKSSSKGASKGANSGANNGGSSAVMDSLRTIFVENLGIEAPSPDTDLLAGGILDLFQVVELLFQLESRLGVAIELDKLDLEDLRTLAGVARIVAKDLSSKRAKTTVT